MTSPWLRISSGKTYLYGVFLINLVLTLEVAHVFNTPGYAPSAGLLFLFPGTVAVNLAVTAFLLTLRPALESAAWLDLVRAADWAVSLMPFLLLRVFRVWSPDRRQHLVGLVYIVFVFGKLAVSLVSVWLERNQSAFFLRRAIFSCSLIIYAAITPWVAVACWPDADEPHYLLLTHSLVKDHDFDLANNYSNSDYKAFYPSDLPYPHAIPNRRGELVPIHDIGISMLLVPGYALGGRTGAMLEESFIGAALAVGLFQMALALGSSVQGALLCWALFSFVSPLVVYASQIYPECTGAALTIWGLIAFAHFLNTQRISALVLAGVCFSPLLWLSVRYVFILGPICAVIGLYLLAYVRPLHKAFGAVSAVAVPIAISLLIFSVFDHRWYGTWLPNAGYVLYVPTMGKSLFDAAHVPAGMLGLIFDRAFGLLPTAPIYVIALAGVWKALRRFSVLVLTLLVPLLALFCFAAINRYWYGGWAPPPRYIFVAVALLVPFAGLVLTDLKSKVIVTVLAAWSCAVAIAYSAFPLTRYTYWDVNPGALSQFMSRKLGFNFGYAFPSFIRAGLRDYTGAAWWACTAVFCIWWLLSRDPESQVTVSASNDRDNGELSHTVGRIGHVESSRKA
jgi:hypothetical protein